MSQRVVIIESPYAAANGLSVETHKRYLDLCIADSVMVHGESPYASHKMLCGPLDDNDARQRMTGLLAANAFRPLVDCHVFYVDFGISPGMKQALDHCREEDLPYEYRTIGVELLILATATTKENNGI